MGTSGGVSFYGGKKNKEISHFFPLRATRSKTEQDIGITT